MRILPIILVTFITLTACQSTEKNNTKTKLEPLSARYFTIHYTQGDNAFSVKNQLVLSAILPYNVTWSLNHEADQKCGSLKRHRGDSYKITPHRQRLNNCQITLSGTVLNSYGEEIDQVSQTFVIQQATPENTQAQWLSGSWGVRFAIPGGADLTQSKADWVSGAQQVVDELSTFGHVMLNFTANARGFSYLLHENQYVDIAREIHPDLVPSKDKEQILFDVIKVFKANNKKVMLYIAADGPAAYMLQRHGRSAPELEQAWENFYTQKYNGDEGLAWRTLLKGFLERLKDQVDGYWVDHVDHMPGELNEFITLIKSVDPKAIIGLNRGKNYIKDASGKFIKVAADKNGPVNTPYRVVSLTPNESFSDFTSGHPTPLVYGAKPNAWAYEEFTFKEVEQAPWVFNQEKATLRHWFGPMRTKWNYGELLFDSDQAYRFVRRITDAGGAITWANTINKGHINSKDLAVLKALDKKMQRKNELLYQPYVRPEAAKLAH
jgi:hypothetical protein